MMQMGRRADRRATCVWSVEFSRPSRVRLRRRNGFIIIVVVVRAPFRCRESRRPAGWLEVPKVPGWPKRNKIRQTADWLCLFCLVFSAAAASDAEHGEHGDGGDESEKDSPPARLLDRPPAIRSGRAHNRSRAICLLAAESLHLARRAK